MGTLTQADLRAALDFAAEIAAVPGVDLFAQTVLGGIRSLVPATIASYDEADPARDVAWCITDPPMAFVEGQEPFTAHMHEHPILRHYRRSGAADVVKISDFLSQRQFRDLGLYQGVFRPVDTEDVITVCLEPGTAGATVVIALHRDGLFSERDRSLLEALRPHLEAAYRNAQAREEVAALRRGLASTGRQYLVVEPSGRILDASPGALDLLTAAFPDAIDPTALLADIVDPRRAPCVEQAGAQIDTVEGTDGRLDVVVLPGGHLGLRLLLLEVRPALLPLGHLAGLGLTRREAEVVRLVVDGRTNAAIASTLVLSPHTVKKHLERIYAKLGVHSRGAVVAVALGASRSAARTPGTDTEVERTG